MCDGHGARPFWGEIVLVMRCVCRSLAREVALCNVFTMCANQGEENLDEADDAGRWDDFKALSWTKASDPSLQT